MTVTALTLYGIQSASTTLTTAAKLVAVTGGVSSSKTTTVGTVQNYGELTGLGTATTWAGLGSLPTSPGVRGWLWDVTTLEGQSIVAGNWSCTHNLALDTTFTTFTSTMYVRVWKRSSAGVYTQIGTTMSGSALTNTVTKTAYTVSGTGFPQVNFATGDKLYMETWPSVTSTGGASTRTIAVSDSSSTTAGIATYAQLVTPGYATTQTRKAMGRTRVVTAYMATILADSPQAYYRLDEASGTTAYDQSGNANHGTLSGSVTFGQTGAVTGESDTATLFGASATLSLPYTLNPSTWTALSLEFRETISEGWQHIVVTVDATGTTYYLNGAVYVPASGDPILIDANLYSAGSYQAGTLDEVALYNYVLTPAQITTHYLAARQLRTAMGRVRSVIASARAGMGRARASIAIARLSAGRARLSAALPTTRNAMGRLRSSITRARSGMGRARLALLAQRMGIGRLRSAISSVKSAAGRAKSSVASTRSGMGRMRLATASTAVRNAAGRVRSSITHRLLGMGRARLALLAQRMGLGRARLAIARALSPIGRMRMAVANRSTAAGRARLVVGSARLAIGRTRLWGQRLLGATGRALLGIRQARSVMGRVRLLATSARATMGRMKLAFQQTTLRSAMGRMRMSLLVARRGIGRFQVALASRRFAAARARLSILQTRMASGRTRLACQATQRATGRAQLSLFQRRTATGRSRLARSTVKGAVGRGRLSRAGYWMAQGRVSVRRQFIPTALNSLGRVNLIARGSPITVTGSRGTITVTGSRGTITVTGSRGTILEED